MEMSKVEVAILEKTVNASAEIETSELDNLQLALVGGGIGSVIFG